MDSNNLTSLRKGIVGVQFLFVAFGATVLVPLLVGLDPSTALFTAGIGTLFFHAVSRGKVPIFLGSSFAFIAPVSAVLAAGLGYEAAKGAFVVFGLSFVFCVLSSVLTLFLQNSTVAALMSTLDISMALTMGISPVTL